MFQKLGFLAVPFAAICCSSGIAQQMFEDPYNVPDALYMDHVAGEEVAFNQIGRVSGFSDFFGPTEECACLHYISIPDRHTSRI